MAYRWTEADLQAKGIGGEVTVPARRLREREAALKVESVEHANDAMLRAMTGNAPKKSKYRNVKTVLDDIEFASIREAGRYAELQMLLRVGAIRNLRRQVRYKLMTEPFKMSYVADFVYEESTRHGGWVEVVEDSKGFRNREYLRKRKAMKAVHGITIRET